MVKLRPLAKRVTRLQMAKRLYKAGLRATRRGVTLQHEPHMCRVRVLGRWLTDKDLAELRGRRGGW